MNQVRVAAGALVAFALGLPTCARPVGMPDVPLPPGAREVQRELRDDGPLEISFSVLEPYPSSRVREFYASWARKGSWEQVPQDEEYWTTSGWESLEDPSGAKVDQSLVHWRSADREWSFRLVLLYRGNRSKQLVTLLIAPYHLLGTPGDEPPA